MNPKFLKFVDKIYVVSMSSSQDRREYIVDHFKENGITDYEFFDATSSDSRRVSELFKNKLVLKFPPCFRCGQTDCGKDDCNNVLTTAQVATFDSYVRLWQEVSDKNVRALICEDDIVLNPWWRDVFTKINQNIDNGDLDFDADMPCLLRLGWAKDDEHDAAVPFRIEPVSRMSNPCHAITPAFARGLLKEHTRIDHTVDVFQHLTSEMSKMHALTVFPPVAHELSWSTGALTSLIHPKEIHVNFLKEHGRHAEAAAHAAKIRDHIKHKFYRPLLMVGHPGCGDAEMAHTFKQLGLDIGLKTDGKDGLSVWQFASDEQVPYAKFPAARSRRALVWKHLVHPVRNIKDAIPIIMRDNIFSPASYDFRRSCILATFGVNLNHFPTNFMRAVASYVYWTMMVQKMEPDGIFRIEDGPDQVRSFLNEVGFGDRIANADRESEATDTTEGYEGRRFCHAISTPELWASLPGYLWKEVKIFCETYGYEIPERSVKSETKSQLYPTHLAPLNTYFLQPSGWTRSYLEKRPLRADGKALPWFTYGAIEFLTRIVKPTDRVFEYGAGYSTLWWQSRVTSVTSVEHDKAWCDEIRQHIAKNVSLSHMPESAEISDVARVITDLYFKRSRRTEWQDYSAEKLIRRGLDDEHFQTYAANILNEAGPFDIIVIDGMARRLCAAFAVEKLADGGIIILDNSNRSDYDAAFDILEDNGFYQVPFAGLAPGSNFLTSTSIFTKSIERLAPASHCKNTLSLPEY